MALALVLAFRFVANVAAFERLPEIDKWVKEIDAIVQQLGDTYLGDIEFLKSLDEICSFVEDGSDGLEITGRAADELDLALQSALQGKDLFKDLAIKEYLKMPFTDFDSENTKKTVKADLKNQEAGDDTLWISDDINVESGPDMVKDVQWTANVMPHMSDQLKNNSLIDFMYIGTASGVLRVLPEMELQQKDLEFRLQSWYLGKASYQQVIIIMDTSSSMGLYEEEYLVTAKEVAVMLVQSFTSHVDFNVITSSSMIWDIQGQTIEHSTMFLRCLHPPLCEFYSANEQNKNSFIDFIWRIKPRGGTDLHRALTMAFELLGNVKSCKKTIYLITSGQDRDKRVRCSSGTNHYLEENQRRFVPGDVCKYNVETTLLDVSIMQYFVQHQVDINTFITTSQYIFYRRSSRIACQNGGVSLWINHTKGYYAQTKLYSYLTHYSFADSGLLIETSTLTAQSYESKLFFSEAYFIPNSNSTNEFNFNNGKEEMRGVLGFAINFATLHNLLLGHIWTGAFAFLVRPRDLIVKCYTGLTSAIELSQFELTLDLLLNPRGELKEFENIQKVVTSLTPGKVRVTSNPGIPMMSKEGALMIVPVSSSVDYYFSPLKSINYTLGFIEFGKRITLTNCIQPEAKSRLHTRLDFDPGKMVSAVALLRKAFCDWNSFNLQYNSSEWDRLEDDMNSHAPTYRYSPCDGIVTNQARLEIKATHQLESIWSSLPSLYALLIHIDSRFVLTNGGVLRIFPALIIPKFDLETITSHGWYREAIENEGHIVLTQQKYSGKFLKTEESSIFISKAVYSPVNNCNSSYSNSSQCAVFGVFGVTGVLKDTAILFSKAIEKYHTECGMGGTSCYIISRNLDVSIELLPLSGNFKKPVNLFERHPFEMISLVKDGIVTNLSLPVMLEKCYNLGDFAYMENLNEEVFFRRDQSNPGSTKMKTKLQYRRPCLKQAYQMMINHSAFLNMDFRTTTVKVPCFHSTVYLSPIRSSSQFLMVVLSTQTFAENCDKPLPLKKPITDIFYFSGGIPRNITKCAPPVFVPVPCLVSAANNSTCSRALLFFACILSGLLKRQKK